MTLDKLREKVKVLLEDNKIPGETECEIAFVDFAGAYEKQLVGMDTVREYGEFKVKLLVQAYY